MTDTAAATIDERLDRLERLVLDLAARLDADTRKGPRRPGGDKMIRQPNG